MTERRSASSASLSLPSSQCPQCANGVTVPAIGGSAGVGCHPARGQRESTECADRQNEQGLVDKVADLH
jgi:hypothetical protein